METFSASDSVLTMRSKQKTHSRKGKTILMGFPMMCGVLFAVLFSLWLLFDHQRRSRCRRSEQKQYRLTAQKSLERLVRLMEEEDVTMLRMATVRNGEARSDYALPHLGRPVLPEEVERN